MSITFMLEQRICLSSHWMVLALIFTRRQVLRNHRQMPEIGGKLLLVHGIDKWSKTRSERINPAERISSDWKIHRRWVDDLQPMREQDIYRYRHTHTYIHKIYTYILHTHFFCVFFVFISLRTFMWAMRNKLIIKCTTRWSHFQVIRFVYITLSQQKYVINKSSLFIIVCSGRIYRPCVSL